MYASAAAAPPPGAANGAQPMVNGGNGRAASTAKKSSRINPAQMPRPTAECSPVRVPPREHSCRLEEAGGPPPATCNYVVAAPREGDPVANCSPRYARCTTGCLLADAADFARAKLPLALLLRPMAKRRDAEAPLDLVDFGSSGPPRCGQCKAYISAFARWESRGDRWTCHLCGFANEAPQWYQCGTDGSGLRRDRFQRAELRDASVDLVVKKDYCVRPVQARAGKGCEGGQLQRLLSRSVSTRFG